MITIEMTLNYNHVKSVLGPGGRIYFPSQLIPMILGGFTFVRLMWKKIVESRSQSPVTKSAQDLSSAEPAEDISTSKSLMKLMTPPSPVPKTEKARNFQNADIDPRMRDTSLGWRLLVSYLPWFSLMARFSRRGADEPTPTTVTINDLEKSDHRDQDTPEALPDPRSNGRFANNQFRLKSPLSLPKSQDEESITRFENRIP